MDFYPTTKPSGEAQASVGLEGAPLAAALAGPPMPQIPDASASVGDAIAQGDFGDARGAASEQLLSHDASAWAETNDAHRKAAARFLAGDPLDRMVLVRLCLEPFSEILARQFLIAGDDWERE